MIDKELARLYREADEDFYGDELMSTEAAALIRDLKMTRRRAKFLVERFAALKHEAQERARVRAEQRALTRPAPPIPRIRR